MKYEIIKVIDDDISELEIKDIVNKKLSIIMNIIEFN
mgnify:CR=1 FL=1